VTHEELAHGYQTDRTDVPSLQRPDDAREPQDDLRSAVRNQNPAWRIMPWKQNTREPNLVQHEIQVLQLKS
jgi:hypothetical protein